MKKSLPEYEDWRLLGQGTFSIVYLVRERDSGKQLACKVVTVRELAERENEFLQKASHPLFPGFERFEQLQEYFCIFMEYIPGITLKELILRRGPLTERQVAGLGRRLAEGLLFLHEQKIPIIYRDLKAENVLIQQDGRVRLIDLGCACYVEETRGTLAGTRGYAAPEQLEGDGKVDVESDVYALGKILQFAAGVRDSGGKEVFSRLLSDMTRPERQRRVPDMRIFLQRMEQFTPAKKKQNIKNAIIQFRKRRIRQRKKMRNMEFYYQKNINRGT